MDLEHLDREAGYHLAWEAPEMNGIAFRIRPARKFVTAIDMEPYEQQDTNV